MLLQICLLISKISYAIYVLERRHTSFSKRKKKEKETSFLASLLPERSWNVRNLKAPVRENA